MQINSVQRDKGPYTGYTEFTNSGKAITALGDASGATTTFTTTTVTDSVAWTMTGIAAGMVAKTSGGWLGLIKSVDDAGDSLTVEKWELKGQQGDKRAAQKPAAGETVQVHRVHKCARLTLYGGGTPAFFAQVNPPVTPNWVRLSATAADQASKVVLEPKMAQTLDLTEWYGITASSTATVYWIAE